MGLDPVETSGVESRRNYWGWTQEELVELDPDGTSGVESNRK